MKIRSILLGKGNGDLHFLMKRFLSNSATFETKEFKLHLFETGPSTKVNITKEEANLYYRQMVTIRQMESAVANLYERKLIRGFCHLQTGQEAGAVGLKAVIRSMDSIITGYRTHGWSYLMGINLVQIIAELLGKKTGSSQGKGGSMHIYGKNFYGGNGIVAAQVPLGAGIAFAAQYFKSKGVSFSIFGDGAARQAQVFETFNMAKLWKLPIVFVCENNGHALSLANTSPGMLLAQSLEEQTDFYTLGDYIPGVWVDGTDVLSVKEASRFALNHCLNNKGPILLELYTPAEISLTDSKTSDVIDSAISSMDPIYSFRNRILLSGLTSEEELKLIDEAVKEKVNDSVARATKDSGPDKKDLTTDVYVHSLQANIRNVILYDY